MRERIWFPLTLSTVTMGPLLVVLGVATALYGYTAFLSPYWLDLASKSSISMLLLAPGFSAFCAWDAARWRQLSPIAVRSWITLLGVQLLAVAVFAAFTFLISMAGMWSIAPPAAGFPRLDVTALVVWVTVGYSALGFLIGRFIPRIVAAPLAFGIVWMWVAYTPAIQPFWLRNVTGNIGASCCGTTQSLAPEGIIAPVVIALSLVVGVCALLVWSRVPLAWAGAACAVVAAVAAGASLVSGLGSDPVRPRTGQQVCRSEGELTLCAFPENEKALAGNFSALAEAVNQLQKKGLAVPSHLEEGQRLKGWRFTTYSGDSLVAVSGLATSPVDRLPSRCLRRRVHDVKGYLLADTMKVWLQIAAGVPKKKAVDDTAADPVLVGQVLALSPEDQLAWYEGTYAELNDCQEQKK